LIVGASGMGETVHLLNLVLSAFGSEDAEVGGIFDGKASGAYAPVRDGIDWYVDDQESSEWWEILADRLEEEVQRLPERQARIKAGEHVRMRILIQDRKSTRLNSSHVKSSYAVFCLKIKNADS